MWPSSRPARSSPGGGISELVKASLYATETVMSPHYGQGPSPPRTPSIEDLLAKYAPPAPASNVRGGASDFLDSSSFGIKRLAASTAASFALPSRPLRNGCRCNSSSFSVPPSLMDPPSGSLSDPGPTSEGGDLGLPPDRLDSLLDKYASLYNPSTVPDRLPVPGSCESRKSSTGDSAIDVGAGPSPAPQWEGEHRPHSPQQWEGEDRPRSPRLRLDQVQTPSFTQLAPPPPSVVISDHSSGGAEIQENGVEPEAGSEIRSWLTEPPPSLQRNLSCSSVCSDYADSCRSAFSDSSSYSLDDDDSDFPCEQPKLAKACSKSVSPSTSIVPLAL